MGLWTKLPEWIPQQDPLLKSALYLAAAHWQEDWDSRRQGKYRDNVVLHMPSVQDIGASRSVVNNGSLNKLRVEHSLADRADNELRPLGEERSGHVNPTERLI